MRNKLHVVSSIVLFGARIFNLWNTNYTAQRVSGGFNPRHIIVYARVSEVTDLTIRSHAQQVFFSLKNCQIFWEILAEVLASSVVDVKVGGVNKSPNTHVCVLYSLLLYCIILYFSIRYTVVSHFTILKY